MFTTIVVNSGRSSRYRGGAGQGRDAVALLLLFFSSGVLKYCWGLLKVVEGCLKAWKAVGGYLKRLFEESTARAIEGNAVRFRPSPLPGHVKPNAPNQDIAWDWNSLKDINNRKQVTCDFCGKITTGGITQAKRHQMGMRGDCGSCHKCPEDVKETLKAAFINKKNERDAYLKETNDLDEDHELVEEISAIRQGKRAASMATSIASSQTASIAKKPKVENDPEVMDGLYKCIERLSTSSDDEDKALDEISLYRRAGGLFGIKTAIRKRSTKSGKRHSLAG
ncbi:hypothetical protein RJT34_16962 [Clitoria ternatea]|uniref:BED-type domain-containing protein n=1 Tax=Clitoria ternatea TaxID=43366 RepID=A0AAN9PE50_CLITE